MQRILYTFETNSESTFLIYIAKCTIRAKCRFQVHVLKLYKYKHDLYHSRLGILLKEKELIYHLIHIDDIIDLYKTFII